jgi:hypothetical protein
MFMELGGGTNRTELGRISSGKFRNANDELVHGRGATEMKVSKALMPQEAELVARETVEDILRRRSRSRGGRRYGTRSLGRRRRV